jgi:para-aminobenzoate synthetase
VPEHGDGVPLAELAARHRRMVWLDGGGAREWSGRRSVLGLLDDDDVSLTYDAARREVVRHAGGRAEVVGDDPFAVLEVELAAGPDDAQWFGCFGYAARPDLPARPDAAPGGAGLPDAVWMRAGEVRFVDHPAAAGTARRTRREDGPQDVPEAYARAFARVQEALHAGHSYEVNLTHRLTRDADPDPVATYLRLRALNPAPYAGFLQHDTPGARAWLLSSSPERYALVSADRRLETKPIKGTTPRGTTAAEDERLRRLLTSDPKYRAENLMIVDLLRNDLSTVCRPGTVTVPSLMEVESYESVHQLVSTVSGRLADGVSTVAALRALFPAGSMTGAPKLRTMEIVDAVEATPRGVYSGAFGWVSADGRADLGVVIRSLVTDGSGTWTLGTGGGITVRSDVADEYAETLWKAERLLRALQ